MAIPIEFLIPRSGGAERARRGAEALASYLSARLQHPVRVRVAESYEDMERELIAGSALAAWAPPRVHARVEAYGGRVLARAVRQGRDDYRAALVARADRTLALADGANLTAAWVDRGSVSGFLLPQAWLRAHGLRAWQVFARELFLGSFDAALDAVVRGDADLASVTVHSDRHEGALAELRTRTAAALQILGITAPCPNDAFAAAAQLPPAMGDALRDAALALGESPEGRSLLSELFEAERFERAEPGGYKRVYALLVASLPR